MIRICLTQREGNMLALFCLKIALEMLGKLGKVHFGIRLTKYRLSNLFRF